MRMTRMGTRLRPRPRRRKGLRPYLSLQSPISGANTKARMVLLTKEVQEVQMTAVECALRHLRQKLWHQARQAGGQRRGYALVGLRAECVVLTEERVASGLRREEIGHQRGYNREHGCDA
jgi:hypothetical protein